MRALLPLLVFSLFSWPAVAQEVNLRNANLYYEGYDVRVQKPGVPLELTRVYNSRSNLKGYFGYGWSTNLDILCQEGPDGSVLVTDADGFIMRYTPHGEPRERLMERYVDRLVIARRDQDTRSGSARSDAFYEDLRQQLIDTPDMRRDMGTVLASAWLDAAPGEYISYDRGTERLTKKGDGSYVRYRADGTQYHFDKTGLLSNLLDAGGRGIRLDYDRDGRLVKVSHTDGGSITVSYAGSFVSSILDTEGRRISFGYDDRDNLVTVEGPSTRKLAYAYDDEHNLTAARLADGTGFQVSYDSARDWVQAVKVGEEVSQYSWAVSDDQHYTCTVTDPAGQITRHLYDDAENREIVEYPDGTREETLLSACCSKPLEVRDEEGVTRYDYDPQARLVGIVFPGGSEVRYAYHPQWSRVVQAMHSDGRRYSYTYDDVGNLTQASDGAGRTLTLRYGDNGKVDEIRDQDGATYRFIYDTSGRPTQIARGAEGSLTIRYGINGEIRSTEVAEGSSAQTDLFDDLRAVLSVLEPATGSLQ